jgi:hypothetical protein
MSFLNGDRAMRCAVAQSHVDATTRRARLIFKM